MTTTIKLKNSVVKDRIPDPSTIQIGELCVGAHSESPALFFKDNADNIIKIEPGAEAESGPVPPLAPGVGELWFDSDNDTLNYWDGSQWQEVASGSGVEGEYLKLTGGDLTGDLTLGTDKITLDASGGRVTADGGHITDGTTFSSPVVIGKLSGTTTSTLRANGDLLLGGNLAGGSPNITLSQSGAITAAGSFASGTGGFYRTGQSGIVFSGNAIIPTDGNGVPNNTLNDLGATLYQFKDGYFYGKVTTGSITAVETSTFADGDILLNSDGSASFGDANIVLRADGSSTFLGDVAIGDSATFFNLISDVVAALSAEIKEEYADVIDTWNQASAYTDVSTLPADIPTPLRDAVVRATTAGKINLNANDGSIVAAGAIQSGGLAYDGDRGFVTSKNGTVYVSSVANGQIWQGYTEGSTTPTSSIFADGSITAKGRLSVTTPSTGGDYTVYFKNEDASGVRQNAFAFTNDGKLDFFAGAASAPSTIEIDSVSGDGRFNGSITAAGQIDANGGLEAYIPTNNLLSYSQRWFDNKYSTRGVVATMGMGGSLWTKQSVNVGTDANNAQVTLSSGGSITAKGRINAGSSSLDNRAIAGYSNSNTAGTISASNSNPLGILFQGYNESVSNTASTFEVSSTGAITAAGDLQVGESSFSGNNDGVIVQTNGRITASAADGSDVWNGFTTGGNSTSSIGADGSASFSGTVTATVVPPSDARFKENIEPAKPQLADVVALGGILKNYDWNDDAPLSVEIRSQRQLGLIAQEAEEICPTITKEIARTKQGAMLTPEETIPAVYEYKVVPAEYKTIVIPAKLDPKGNEVVAASTEEVLVVPEYTEQVLVTPEQVIPATYEVLDDSYKGISTDALIMKLIGAVAELSAEVTALKAEKLTEK